MRANLCFTIAFVVGCSGHPPAEHKPEPPAATPADSAVAPARDCKAEATELGTFLTGAAKLEGPVLQAHRDVHLVKRTDLTNQRLVQAPVITANATATSFMGSIVELAELRSRMTALRPRVSSSIVILQLDEATPWGTVVDLVSTAQSAGFTAPMFVFETDRTSSPPPRSAVDDKLDALIKQGPLTGRQLGELAREIVQSCPALVDVFRNVAGVDALIAAIPPALIACDCKLDLASFRSVTWRAVAVTVAIGVIAFDDTTRAQTLVLPRVTSWAEASKQLPAGTKGLTLVAR